MFRSAWRPIFHRARTGLKTRIARFLAATQGRPPALARGTVLPFLVFLALDFERPGRFAIREVDKWFTLTEDTSMSFEKHEIFTSQDAPLELDLCNLEELEPALLEQLNDGWRVAQIRAYDLHRLEKMKAKGLSHGYLDEHKPDVELDYLRQSGRLKTLLAVGEVQAVSIMVFDEGHTTPSELTMRGCPTRLGDLECVRLPSCGETRLSWAYAPDVVSHALFQRGFAGGESLLLDALSLLAGRVRFRGQQLQLLEVLRKNRGDKDRWRKLLSRVESAVLADGDPACRRTPVVVAGLDECLMGLVAQRLAYETERLQARLVNGP